MALAASPATVAFNMLLCLGLVIVWYIFIGHHILGAFINRAARVLSGDNVVPRNVYERKVDSLVGKEKFDEAIKKCREWLKHDRDSSEPIMRICDILIEHQDKVPQAIQELELAVSRPCAAQMHVTYALRLAELYRKTGREKNVEVIYRRVRSFHSKSPEIERLS